MPWYDVNLCSIKDHFLSTEPNPLTLYLRLIRIPGFISRTIFLKSFNWY